MVLRTSACLVVLVISSFVSLILFGVGMMARRQVGDTLHVVRVNWFDVMRQFQLIHLVLYV